MRFETEKPTHSCRPGPGDRPVAGRSQYSPSAFVLFDGPALALIFECSRKPLFRCERSP